MSIIVQAWTWLTSPDHWHGPGQIPDRIAEHLAVTLLVIAIAAMIAIPLGVIIGHTGRGVPFAVAFTGGLRSLPTLGLLTIVGLWVGIGLTAPTVALVVLAVPPMLTGVYAGMRSVDRNTIDAAHGIGMARRHVIVRVELPLASASIVAGIRSATLQVVSTVTIAAYVADVGLGRFLFAGLSTRDYGQMIGGAILVIAIAIMLDGVAAVLALVVRRRLTPHTVIRSAVAT